LLPGAQFIDAFSVAIDGPALDARRAAERMLTHNFIGRLYLAIIVPFHRLVVRALLRQVAARDELVP
jgi:hypothetical protein